MVLQAGKTLASEFVVLGLVHSGNQLRRGGAGRFVTHLAVASVLVLLR